MNYLAWDDDGAVIHTVQTVIVICSSLILLVFYGLLSIVNEKLREKEELFRTMFEQSPIGIAIGNNYNYILDNNPMYEKIIGRSKEEIHTLKWEAFTHPDDVQKDLEKFTKLKSGAIGSYSLNKRYIRPNGSIVWVNLTVAPLKNRG
jgi:PAS domain S-box-containing protein